MPMQNNGFQWRPNDNSAVTNLRYTLEAEKWVNAVSSAQRKSRPGSVSADFAMIGLVLQLVFNVLLLILLGTLQLIRSLVYLVEVNLRKTEGPSSDGRESKIPLKLTASFKKPNVVVWDLASQKKKISSNQQKKYKRPNPLIYDTYGEPWAIWKILFRFVFIFLCVYIGIGISAHFISPDFDMADRGFLYFTGAVSIYFAIAEMD